MSIIQMEAANDIFKTQPTLVTPASGVMINVLYIV